MTSMPSSIQPPKVATKAARSGAESWRIHEPLAGDTFSTLGVCGEIIMIPLYSAHQSRCSLDRSKLRGNRVPHVRARAKPNDRFCSIVIDIRPRKIEAGRPTEAH